LSTCFSKPHVLWHVGKMCHVTYLSCKKSYIERSMDHQKASSQDKGLQRRRPSEADVSREATAEGLLEFVDLTREFIAGTLRPSTSATWLAPAETGDRPLTLADRAMMRTPHQRSSGEHGDERRSSSIDQSSRSAKEKSTSSRAENYSSTASAGSVVSASVAATAEVAGSQPAERAVLSGSRRTEEKGPESTVRAAAVTTTAANDSAPGPQPVSRTAPPQRTSGGVVIGRRVRDTRGELA